MYYLLTKPSKRKKMEKPLVSIIVPVYNGEKYLTQCLNSILNQTYQYFEIIIINDNSPDNSKYIIDHFAKKEQRIKVVKNDVNLGAMVRHKGIQMSQGEFILFLDQDDWLNRNGINDLLNKILEEKADIAYGQVTSVIDKNKIIKRKGSNNCAEENLTNSINQPELFEHYFISYFGINILRPSLLGNLYRRSIFEKAGFFSQPSAIVGADLFLNLWIHPYLEKVCFLQSTVLYYRWGGMTNKANPNYLRNMKEAYEIKKIAIKEFHYDKATPYIKIELANVFYTHFQMLLHHSKMTKSELTKIIEEELSDNWYSEEFKEMGTGRAYLLKDKKIDKIADEIWINYKSSIVKLRTKQFLSRILN